MKTSAPGGAAPATGPYLLDSSALIRSLRGDVSISQPMNSASQVFVSSIVLGELYFGAFGSPTRPDDAVAEIEVIEQTISALAPDAGTARIYAQVRNDIKRRGLMMPNNDLWIAATAMQYDVTLAARDAHFNWITGLRVEQW